MTQCRVFNESNTLRFLPTPCSSRFAPVVHIWLLRTQLRQRVSGMLKRDLETLTYRKGTRDAHTPRTHLFLRGPCSVCVNLFVYVSLTLDRNPSSSGWFRGGGGGVGPVKHPTSRPVTPVAVSVTKLSPGSAPGTETETSLDETSSSKLPTIGTHLTRHGHTSHNTQVASPATHKTSTKRQVVTTCPDLSWNL